MEDWSTACKKGHHKKCLGCTHSCHDWAKEEYAEWKRGRRECNGNKIM